jgi:hypothetical protein
MPPHCRHGSVRPGRDPRRRAQLGRHLFARESASAGSSAVCRNAICRTPHAFVISHVQRQGNGTLTAASRSVGSGRGTARMTDALYASFGPDATSRSGAGGNGNVVEGPRSLIFCHGVGYGQVPPRRGVLVLRSFNMPSESVWRPLRPPATDACCNAFTQKRLEANPRAAAVLPRLALAVLDILASAACGGDLRLGCFARTNALSPRSGFPAEVREGRKP